MLTFKAVLSRIGSWFKAVWDWFRRNPLALAAAIGGAVGAFLVYKSSRNKINRLEDAVIVQATKAKIAADEAKAEALAKQGEEKAEQIKVLEKSIAESRRRVVEIHEQTVTKDMTDEEVAEAFSNAGF